LSGRVLIADGNSERGKAIAEACSARGIDCGVEIHGAAALEAALVELPALLVAQVELPLIEGPQLGAILRANPRTEHTGLLLVCDRAADAARCEPGLELMRPPFEPEDVATRVVELLDERRSEAPDEEDEEGGGVEGQLSQLPLGDLLQLFHVSRKTGIVELDRGDGPEDRGRVWLQGGDVIQAVSGSVEGEKALYRLLAWHRGAFAFHPGLDAVGRGIHTPTRALLREGQRQLRERERLAVALPPLDGRVTLNVQRATLPNVIHPLTQEVLLVLELYSRVADVVDHCAYPDYQVLRTLRTLIDRGVVDLSRDGAAAPEPEKGLFSAAKAARLREWLEAAGAGTPEYREAKIAVLASDRAALETFGRRVCQLPGALPAPRLEDDALDVESLAPLAHLRLADDVGLELIHVPMASRFAPVWPLAAHGALAVVFALAGPVREALATAAEATETLRRLPRARLFHVLQLDPGEGGAPEALRGNPALLDESSLFLLPSEKAEKAQLLLRELFARILP